MTIRLSTHSDIFGAKKILDMGKKSKMFFLMMLNCLKKLFVAFILSKNAQLGVFWLIFVEKSHFGDPIEEYHLGS